MTTTFNPVGITLKLNSDELSELYNYAMKCINEGFSGINDFNKVNPEREFYYKWMLKDLIAQLFDKAYKAVTREQRSYKLTVTEAHQRMLSMMFRRVECSSFLLTIQPKLLNKLQKLQQ